MGKTACETTFGRRIDKLSLTVCASCEALANAADGCWKPVLYLSLDITWCRDKD